jgi:hypothetical protein
LVALYKGTILVVPPPVKMDGALAPATAHLPRKSNRKKRRS